MRMLSKMLIATAFSALFSISAASDQEFEVWESQTFAAPYTDGTIAVSNVITNTNGFDSLELILEYEALSPDRSVGESASFLIFAVIEHEIGGHWYPAATTWDKMNNLADGPTRIIIFGPHSPDFNGVDNLISSGNAITAHQSFNIGKLGANFRVRLTVDGAGSYPLTSVTLSAYGRKYDG